MAIRYTCEGCGSRVYHLTLEDRPAHGFCATCEWLERHLPPEDLVVLSPDTLEVVRQTAQPQYADQTGSMQS